MSETDIVDAWAQHPTKRFAEHRIFESLRRWMGVKEIPTIPTELTAAVMQQAGVGTALLSAWEAPDGSLISNDELAEQVASQPALFRGVGSVSLHNPMEAVREIRRCKRELGFVGIRVLPWLWNAPPNDRRYYPIYVACIEEGLPFCLQVGHTGPLAPSDPGRPIPYLDQVALDFPELVIVGGHIGYPWTTEMIALATKYPNVYIETSAYTPQRYPAELVSYMRRHGRKKVLFGTNYPMIQPGKCAAQLADLELDAETLDAFLRGNARRVFGLKAGAA